MSLTSLLPPPPVQIGDKTFQLKPFTINEIAKLQQWIDSTYRSPLQGIIPLFATLPADVRAQAFAAAKSWQPPQIGTPEADEMFRSIGGLRQIFRILLAASDPNIGESQADAIAATLPFAEFMEKMGELMEVAFGKTEDDPAPKAE